MSYTDPAKRHDFVLLFDVADGNPNGDPDAGNLPRTDPENMRGLVTDVALKRKVRDYAAGLRGEHIFIQSQTALNTLYFKASRLAGAAPVELRLGEDREFDALLDRDEGELLEWLETLDADGLEFDSESRVLTYLGESRKKNDFATILKGDRVVSKGLEDKLQRLAAKLESGARGKPRPSSKIRDETRKVLCRQYYDIRMFGAVLTGGTNAGQVRGPMQLKFARSISAILPLDLAITRQARTTTTRMQTGPTEMGRKPIVPYGLYRTHGFFNPYLAAQTGVTEGDLALFWDALGQMWDFDRSASRGEMACRGVYIFTHDNPLGNAPAHKLLERVTVESREENEAPRSFSDYEVIVDESDLPSGVTLTRLYV